jgi:hypothetical protein
MARVAFLDYLGAVFPVARDGSSTEDYKDRFWKSCVGDLHAEAYGYVILMERYHNEMGHQLPSDVMLAPVQEGDPSPGRNFTRFAAELQCAFGVDLYEICKKGLPKLSTKGVDLASHAADE